MYLEHINGVDDLRSLSEKELAVLCEELRAEIIDVVSETGGHLAPNLGVVELTVALHYAFNTPTDRLIWDVGHQCYTHKILTGRRKQFKTLRQFNGLSGFPKHTESPFDCYDTGHSSTSLSLALGEAVARDLNNENYKVVAVIGDGSMTAGEAFEALNQMGHLQKNVIVILNDNELSISKNVGGLSHSLTKYESLTRLISSSAYNKVKSRFYHNMSKVPLVGKPTANFFSRTENTLKGILVPGAFFEELGVRYFGPIDGHNLPALIAFFNKLKDIDSGPILVQVRTKKGKGFKPSEKHPDIFHGIGCFNKHDGKTAPKNQILYSHVVGSTLCELAKDDDKIVALTAAMTLGTGLEEFSQLYPDRFFDVGIAEQHAVTFASALAKNGYKPFISIYSTFMQRALDQIVHDVGIMNVPVKLLIDRAGLVGKDGETHQGLFDIAFFRCIPNLIFLSPVTGTELRDTLYWAANYNDGPVAIRFPRGAIKEKNLTYQKFNPIDPLKVQTVKDGADVLFLAVGDMVPHAVNVADKLASLGLNAGVVNLRALAPLDLTGISKNLKQYQYFVTIENGYLDGGIGEALCQQLSHAENRKFLSAIGFPKAFIEHGSVDELFCKYHLDVDSLAQRILEEVENAQKA